MTEAGLVPSGQVPAVEFINVGGMRVQPESFVGLLSISPALQIKSFPRILNLDAGSRHVWTDEDAKGLCISVINEACCHINPLFFKKNIRYIS